LKLNSVYFFVLIKKGLPVKTIEEKERETAERLKNLQVKKTASYQ